MVDTEVKNEWHNIGQMDNIVRVIIAIILVLLGLFTGARWLYLITVLLLITVFTGYCPIYRIFKFNTIEKTAPPASPAAKARLAVKKSISAPHKKKSKR
jgi:hypothetical protein